MIQIRFIIHMWFTYEKRKSLWVSEKFLWVQTTYFISPTLLIWFQYISVSLRPSRKWLKYLSRSVVTCVCIWPSVWHDQIKIMCCKTLFSKDKYIFHWICAQSTYFCVSSVTCVFKFWLWKNVYIFSIYYNTSIVSNTRPFLNNDFFYDGDHFDVVTFVFLWHVEWPFELHHLLTSWIKDVNQTKLGNHHAVKLTHDLFRIIRSMA